MNMYRLFLVTIFVTVLAGCSDDSEPVASKAQKVLDTFNVGGVYVRSLAVEPKANSIWVGTSAGVMEIDLATHELRNTFTRDHGLANEYVFGIFVDSQGYKWFGTNGGGMSRYKDGEWKTYFPLHGLADYWIYTFAEEPEGVLWVGTWAGANRLEVSEEKFTTYFDELINEWVYGLSVDSKNRIWFGTEGGVSMFDGKDWKEWSHKDGMGAPNKNALPASANTGLGTRMRHDLSVLAAGGGTYNPNYVFTIHVDSDDTVWAGTWGGGVASFDGMEWKNYTTDDGLAGNLVYKVTQDAEGVYWFGTNGGLSRFDGENWTSYTVKDGLFANDVYDIAIASNGDIWVGTLGGVVRLGY